MGKATTILGWWLAAAVLSAQTTVPLAGTFDIKTTDPSARLLAAATDGSQLAIVASYPNASELIVFDSQFRETARATLAGNPRLLALASDGVLTFELRNSQESICRYNLSGVQLSPCTAIPEWPLALGEIGGTAYSVGWFVVRRHDPGTGGWVTVAEQQQLKGEKMLLGVISRQSVVWLSPITLRGQAYDLARNEGRDFSAHSAELETLVSSRGPSNPVASMAVAGRGGELWVGRARYRPSDGWPVDRFEHDGRFVGTSVFQIPQFQDLVLPVGQVRNVSNPVGNLLVRFFGVVGDNAVAIDYIGKRAAYYSLDSITASARPTAPKREP